MQESSDPDTGVIGSGYRSHQIRIQESSDPDIIVIGSKYRSHRIRIQESSDLDLRVIESGIAAQNNKQEMMFPRE